MRTILICHLILALWLLPFAGAQAGYVMGDAQQHHDSARGEHVVTAQQGAHNSGPEREHGSCNDTPPPPAPEHRSAASIDSEVSHHADCCDGNECVSDCGNGCGHCVAQGHSCSIPTLNTLTHPIRLQGESLSFVAQPYSHIGPQPTPPPNIA